MPVPISQSVQIYNICKYLKFVWTDGDDTGRIDYLRKGEYTIQQTNADEFWIRHNDHTLYFSYIEIDQTQPTDHTTQDELINILLEWTCLDGSSAGGASSITHDSFGRTRIASSINVFNAQYRYDYQPLLYNIKVVDNGTVTHNTTPSPAVYLDTTTTGVPGINTDKAIFQTKEYMPYQANSTMYITIGATLRTVSVVNFNTARLGYYDDATDKDITADIGGTGAFFQMNPNGSINVVLRKYLSGTQTDVSVTQTNWNLDQMDGSGASLVNIDFTKAQLYCFEFEMNSSRVRLGFNINGSVIWCHQFIIYNLLDEPTLFNYTLPIRAEIFNNATITDTAVAAEMKIYSQCAELCGSINASNNAFQSNPFSYSIGSSIDAPIILSTNGNHKPIILIRLKKTLCRASIWPLRMNIINENGSLLLWRLILNPTGITPTWQNVKTNYSFTEYSISDNAITIGANSIILASGYMYNPYSRDLQDLFETFGLHASIDGATPDILALSVEYVKGNSRVRGSLEWQETK